MTQSLPPITVSKSNPPGTILRFFLITFLFTWLLQVPGLLAQRDLLPGGAETYMPFVMLGIFGPLAAAVYLSAREGGWRAIRELFTPLLQWRVRPRFYIFALLAPALLLTIGLNALSWAGYQGEISYWANTRTLIGAVVISLAEEVGWRGYALPRLQTKFDPLTASSIIALFWGVWHIPMFLGQGISLNLSLVMMLYFLGASLVFTWVYNGSGGSLLLAVLAHMGAHLNNSMTALPGDQIPFVVHAIIYASIGLAVSRSLLTQRYQPASTATPATATPL